MSIAQELRRIDYHDYYSSKIEELERSIRQFARKGHGHRKLREQTHRLYRNGSRPKGFHDYQNLQWDPSIFRGRTFRDFREKNLPPNASTIDFSNYCCVGCNSTKGFSLNRRKTVVGIPRYKVGGVFRPTTNDIIFEESSGRKRHKQDESRKEMEPFITEQLDPPEYSHRGSQSDEIRKAVKTKCYQVAIGASTGTQADVCIVGSGNHDDPIVPILSNMGPKIVEQSLLETFEEYELHAIRSEIRCLIDKHRNRQAREMKQVEYELLKAERLEWDRYRRDQELQKELQATEMVAASLYSMNVCNSVIAQTFKILRKEHVLSPENHDIENFTPLVHRQMYRHLQVPRMIVNDIISNVENNRITDLNLTTLLSGAEKLHLEENMANPTTQSEEEDDFSSLGPPPNTASTILFTTSGDED